MTKKIAGNNQIKPEKIASGWLFLITFVEIAPRMENKTLIDTLSSRLDTSRESVVSLMEGLTSVIGECGMSLDVVTVPSFGSFEPRKRLERVAVHPASGKRLLIPPKITLAFRPSTILKQKIKNHGQ